MGRLSKRYTDQEPLPDSVPTHNRGLAVAFHLLAVASHVWSFQTLFAPSPVSEFMSRQFGRQWNYLTILSLAVSLATFVTAVAKDLLPSNKGLDRLKTSLSIVIVPVEGLVSVLYWTMQAINPKLLTPPGTLFRIPILLDISIHALPAIFLWIDFLVFSPRMSKKANPLLISTIATIAYTSWMEYASSYNGTFPYPFLNTMSLPARLSFYVGMIPVLLGLFYLSNGIHDSLRGKNNRSQALRAEKASKKVESKLQ